MKKSKFYIYFLLDPKTLQIKYVGKTEQNINLRLKQHLSDARNFKIKTHKVWWIRSLLKENLLPLIEIIEEVNEKEWEFWEQWYIDLCRSWGFKLTNLADGGRGATSKNNPARRPEVKDKISKSCMGRKAWSKGKTYVEMYGEDKANKMKANLSIIHTNQGMSEGLRTKKSLEQTGEGNSMYGKKHLEESIIKMKEKASKRDHTEAKERLRKNHDNMRGKTYEELYGEDKAKELKQKRREARLNYLASLLS